MKSIIKMKNEKHKLVFGGRVKVYEPENLKSPRGPENQSRMGKLRPAATSLLSSSDTYHKKSQPKDLSSKLKNISKILPLKWRVRRFTEQSSQKTQDKPQLNRTEHLQSMETKTEKMSLRNRTQTNAVHGRGRNPFRTRNKFPSKMTISDIIEPKPAARHQLWISSLKRNRKSSRTTADRNAPDPYLNMSSFNISDDISHIIPSFSSKIQPRSFRQPQREESSHRESVISQSNFLKNNQSISAIEPDNLSYRFIHKEDPNSFLGEMAQDVDFQINLYSSSGGMSMTNKTLSKKRTQKSIGEKVIPRFNSSCNTLQYNQSEFTKRILSHKKNNPSLNVHNVECLEPLKVVLPKSRHFSQPNNQLPGRLTRGVLGAQLRLDAAGPQRHRAQPQLGQLVEPEFFFLPEVESVTPESRYRVE